MVHAMIRDFVCMDSTDTTHEHIHLQLIGNLISSNSPDATS